MSVNRRTAGSREHSSSSTSAEKHGSPTASAGEQEEDEVKGKPNLWQKFKQAWTKAGLNTATVLMMLKAGIAPAFATAILRIDAIDALFPNLGYIMPVAAFLTLAFLPRAKFIQTLTLSTLSICFAAATAQLAVYTSIKARQAAPSPPGPDGAPGYNSSASAVLGVWLFVQIWAYSSLRGKFAQFGFPVILVCVFTDVVCTGATRLPEVMDGVRYVRSVWYAFMLGFGLGAAVHFLVFPVSMRTVIFVEFSGFYGAVRGAVKAQVRYLHSMEDAENVRRGIGEADELRQTITPEAQAVKDTVKGMQAAGAKLHQDLSTAKREFAFGYMGPDEIHDLSKLNHSISLAVAGLGAIVMIFEQLQGIGALIGTLQGHEEWEETHEERRARVAAEWSEHMQQLHGTFNDYAHLIDDGIEHILLVLRLKKPAKWAAVAGVHFFRKSAKKPFQSGKSTNEGEGQDAADAEHEAGHAPPGSENFGACYKKKMEDLYNSKEIALDFWCKRKGIEHPDALFDNPRSDDPRIPNDEEGHKFLHRRKLRLLYTLFYLEYLMNAVARGVFKNVEYVDKLQRDGILSKRRFIVPGRKRLRKWLSSIFTTTGLAENEEQTNPEVHGSMPSVNMGPAYSRRKNPEHLPPETWIERFGERIRIIPNFLRSSASQFGFRVALATISLAIPAYVRQTQRWFGDEHVNWCLFVVALSMSPSAGASVFALIGRVLGTVYAMLISFAIWYIPDQHPAGIIVFMWLAISATSYIFVCKPRFFSYGTVAVIAILVIAGYQLEAVKFRPEDHGGPPYYPILQFGPRRLLNATIGAATAFFWTIFPFPISEHNLIRHGLGEAIYLLANYHSLVTELARARVREPTEDDFHRGMDDPLSPEYWLEKQREKVASKLTVCLAGLRNYAGFLQYEIPVGGKFPAAQHLKIVDLVNSLLNFMSLANIATRSLNECLESQTAWSTDFRKAMDSAILTNKEITILFTLFSASIDNAVPLPPYLFTPQPYRLADKLEELNKDIFGVSHLSEPYYPAFGVLQVSATCIVKDVDDLLKQVKMLVGELDFSFHISSTADDPSQTLSQSKTREMVNRRKKD